MYGLLESTRINTRGARFGHGLGRWAALLWMSCVVAQAGCRSNAEEPLGKSMSDLTEISGESVLTTWTCTDAPCPWGDSVSNDALSWPLPAGPVATRLGYTVSPAPYLPADRANGLIISITLGNARLYAGGPQEESHRLLAELSEGDSYQVSGLDTDEVLSVQSDSGFGYRVT
jgi:hypothetical protein